MLPAWFYYSELLIFIYYNPWHIVLDGTVSHYTKCFSYITAWTPQWSTWDLWSLWSRLYKAKITLWNHNGPAFCCRSLYHRWRIGPPPLHSSLLSEHCTLILEVSDTDIFQAAEEQRLSDKSWEKYILKQENDDAGSELILGGKRDDGVTGDHNGRRSNKSLLVAGIRIASCFEMENVFAFCRNCFLLPGSLVSHPAYSLGGTWPLSTPNLKFTQFY